MLLIGGVEEWLAIQWEMNMWLRKTGDEFSFNSKLLIPKSQSCTLNSSHDNARTSIIIIIIIIISSSLFTGFSSRTNGEPHHSGFKFLIVALFL
jgi:hypothetical protein